MKHISTLLIFSFLSLTGFSQKYMTKNGYIGFYSHTPIEDIKADNNQVASVLDIASGDLVFQVLIKSFRFEKALMEEHFNENYMESEEFPKSIFKGKIINITDVDFAKPGIYPVKVEGEMNMHGVSKPFSTAGTLEVLADGIEAVSKFMIRPEDYGIKIPGLVRNKISENIEVSVRIKYSGIQ